MLIHNTSQNVSTSTTIPYNLRNKKLISCASSDDIFLFSKKPTFKSKFIHNYPYLYRNMKINKAPTLNQIKRNISFLSTQVKHNHKQMLNSLHKTHLRKSLLNSQSFTHLLITSPDIVNNNGNDSSSYLKYYKPKRNHHFINTSMQETSNCHNSSVDCNNNRFNISEYESMAKEIRKGKMTLQINSLFALTAANPKSLVKRCTEYSLLEKCCKYKKRNLCKLKEDIQVQNDYLDNKKNRLLYYKKLFTEGYFNTLNNYLHFLKKQIQQELLRNESLLDMKQKIEIDVSKLRIEVNRIKKRMSKLSEMRNFLIMIKEQKNYNPMLIECIVNGKENTLKGNFTQTQIDNYKHYLNPNVPIFTSINEFLKCYSDIEQKGMKLLEDSEKTNLNLELLKEELDLLCNEHTQHEEVNQTQILQKQKALNIKKAIHSQLLNQRNGLFNYINSISPSQKRLSHMNNSIANSVFSKEFFAVLKYKDLRKKYNVPFALLYIQLAQQVKLLLELKVITRENLITIGIVRTHEEIRKTLNTKLNKANENGIRNACLKLIQIYERVIILVYEKHKELKKNKTIKEELVRLKIQRQNYVKIKNAEIQRKLLAEKRKMEIGKIILKTNKEVVTVKRKVPEKFYLMSSVNNEKEKKEEKKDEELKFADFVTLENGE